MFPTVMNFFSSFFFAAAFANICFCTLWIMRESKQDSSRLKYTQLCESKWKISFSFLGIIERHLTFTLFRYNKIHFCFHFWHKWRRGNKVPDNTADVPVCGYATETYLTLSQADPAVRSSWWISFLTQGVNPWETLHGKLSVWLSMVKVLENEVLEER